MKNSILKFNITFFGYVMILQGQEVVFVSKSEVLNRAIEENISIKISEHEYLKARADYRQTNSVFFTKYYSISHWNGNNQSSHGTWIKIKSRNYNY